MAKGNRGGETEECEGKEEKLKEKPEGEGVK